MQADSHKGVSALWLIALLALIWPAATLADTPARPEPYEMVAGTEDEYRFIMLTGECVRTSRTTKGDAPDPSRASSWRIRRCPERGGATRTRVDACPGYEGRVRPQGAREGGRQAPTREWSYHSDFLNEQGDAYPASGLYRNDGSTAPIWTVDWYAHGVYVSANGRHLVRMGPWASHMDMLAVAFFEQGCLLKSYAIADLVKNEAALDHTVSHFFWRAQVDFDDTRNLLRIGTVDGGSFLFDVTTGEIIQSESTEPLSTQVP